MYYLVILVILLILVGGLAIIVKSNRKSFDANLEPKITVAPDEECCGAHEVCESDSLLSKSMEVTYYEDYELDRFKNISTTAYTEADIEQFSEVLYTLRENEVAGWLNSLRIREIELPELLRDEALLIVSERRFK